MDLRLWLFHISKKFQTRDYLHCPRVCLELFGAEQSHANSLVA